MSKTISKIIFKWMKKAAFTMKAKKPTQISLGQGRVGIEYQSKEIWISLVRWPIRQRRLCDWFSSVNNRLVNVSFVNLKRLFASVPLHQYKGRFGCCNASTYKPQSMDGLETMDGRDKRKEMLKIRKLNILLSLNMANTFKHSTQLTAVLARN